MNCVQRGFFAAVFLGVFTFSAAPVFAQMYSGYSMNYGSPSINQSVHFPLYVSHASDMLNMNTVPGYSGGYMPRVYTSTYYPQQQYYPQSSYSSYSYNTAHYPSYSYPQYDSSYAPYSDYYTTYPQQNRGFTGDTDAFGNQLCYWQGYGRSDCSFNPHQWVYDPYTGTWY